MFDPLGDPLSVIRGRRFDFALPLAKSTLQRIENATIPVETSHWILPGDDGAVTIAPLQLTIGVMISGGPIASVGRAVSGIGLTNLPRS